MSLSIFEEGDCMVTRRTNRVRTRKSLSREVLHVVLLILSALGPLPACAAPENAADAGLRRESLAAPFYLTTGMVLNELGQIAGRGQYSPAGSGAFFWSDGVLTDLGISRGISEIFDINNKGMVVGYDEFSDEAGLRLRPFLWDNGILTDLGSNGTNGIAFAVNEAGAVALAFGESDGPHAFLWERGALTELGVGIPGDLNERGQVVGLSTDGGGHAVLWDHGLVTDLTPDFDVQYYEPPLIQINNRGQVIIPGGRKLDGTLVPAFLWEQGTLTNLGSLGGDETWPKDINEQGQVVGASRTAAGEIHAFFWERGVMTDLGKSGEHSEAEAINERGQVAVRIPFSPGGAFIWERGVRTDLVDQDGRPVYSQGPLAINNHGEVMGSWGHAYLWERGHLTYVVDFEAAASTEPASTPPLASIVRPEREGAPRSELVRGNVRPFLGAPSPVPVQRNQMTFLGRK
jgi:probable HAF family extracellular repeat protein